MEALNLILIFFGNYPASLDYGQSFPAGHASGGYSWFGLYFFIKHYFYPYKYIGLAFPIILGLSDLKLPVGPVPPPIKSRKIIVYSS
jgi:membrane-associated PAP2 superfamily phosphatase